MKAKPKKTTKKLEPSDDQKILVVEYSNNHVERICVPKNAKITLGSMVPGNKGSGSAGTALRVYVGTDQIAVFSGVHSFREIGPVTVMKKKVQTASKRVAFQEGGIEKFRTVNVTTEDWIDPDQFEESDNALKLQDKLKQEADESF